MTPSLRAALHLLSPGSTPRRGLFLLMISALLAIVAIFAVVMADARSDARRAAEVAEGNLATALAQDTDRNIQSLDLSIQAARDSWSNPMVRALDPELRQLVMFDHSATARYIDAILLVDRDGAVVADSLSAAPRGHDFHDADFFLAQSRSDAGLFIGHPMRMQGKSGWHVALSRRLVSPDGGFVGVAVGFLALDYLNAAYSRLPLGAGGILTLFSTDGTLLVREPEAEQAIGRSLRGQPVFDRISGAESGSFEGTSAIDGVTRLYGFHRVGTLPLIQGVGASTRAIYADWHAKAMMLGGVLALVCIGMVALLVVLKHELVQRVAAEAALDALASTDHLTGLLNRRKFFALAEQRCAEAAHQGLPLSVLMIDADRFKSYNDRYGHAAGDIVLAAVGRCMDAALRRPDDLAARYGGEEFIVLLPGLDRARAFAVAEGIRGAVERLAIPHERATAGIVTVSTGLASVTPGEAIDLRALVETADAELYRSKREGRNRSSGGTSAEPRAQPQRALSA